MPKQHSATIENYLKAIYRLSESFKDSAEFVSTNTVANYLNIAAPTVTDMLKKLSEQELAVYAPYKGVQLTGKGRQVALEIIRKHRLWEVFLVEKLNFSWDNVHEVAEQLEHIRSEELIRSLDAFLGYPRFDPHGDPIPDESGAIEYRSTCLLSEINPGEVVVVVGVTQDHASFLQYLDQIGIALGRRLSVLDRFSFDQGQSAMMLDLNGARISIGGDVAASIQVLREPH